MGKFSRIGNDLYNGDRSIDFVGKRKLWYAISAVVILVAMIGLFGRGLNLGIEFEGGSEYKVSLPTSEVTQDNVDLVRDALSESGIPEAENPTVNTSGTETILITTETMVQDTSDEVIGLIQETLPAATDVSQDLVGASWGQQVVNKSITGLVVFLVLVMLFIWSYFREWKMSVGAIAALMHDIVITVGVYALSGFEVTPATVTGILTILGFSLYDTVVVFDKVRENTANLRKSKKTYAELANLAVNQTLVRSINTSIVALLPVAVILYASLSLGAGALKDLSLSLFVGMAAGAYSSIFIATPLAVHLKLMEKDISASDARAKARARRGADPYAAVPSFDERMPEHEPLDKMSDDGSFAGETGETGDSRPAPVSAPPRRPEASGRGRTAPPAKGPVGPSGSSSRNQPNRTPRSKRK